MDRIVRARGSRQPAGGIRSRRRSTSPTASPSPRTPIPASSTIFSAKFACPVSGFTIPEIEPRLFSFNNPFGACPACDGLGTKLFFDPELVVPDERLSLRDGAIAPWAQFELAILRADPRQPGAPLQGQHQRALEGPAGEGAATPSCSAPTAPPIAMRYDDGLRAYTTTRPFEGVIPNMERRWKETDSAWLKEELGRYQNTTECEACHGKRLKPEALAVKIRGLDIAEVAELSIAEPRRMVRRARPASDRRSSARSPSASSRRSTSAWASCAMSGSNI